MVLCVFQIAPPLPGLLIVVLLAAARVEELVVVAEVVDLHSAAHLGCLATAQAH